MSAIFAVLYCLIPIVGAVGIFVIFIPQKYYPHLFSWLLLTLRELAGYTVEPGIYPVVSAHRFFRILTDHRMLYVRGPLGSGKSTLAAWVCLFLLTFKDEYGRSFVKRVASNIPHRWPRPKLSQGCDMSVIWFDELGLFVDSRSWTKTDSRYWAGLRKLRSVIVGSSRIPVDKRLSELWAQRTNEFPFNYLTNAWFFLWGYESGDEVDTGMFFIYRPQAIWPFYPTSAYPTSDGGVLELLDISIDRAEQLGVQDYLAFDFEPGKPLPDKVSKEMRAKHGQWDKAGRPAFDYFTAQFMSLSARWQVLSDCGDLDEIEGNVILEQVAQLHDLAAESAHLEVVAQIKAWYDGKIYDRTVTNDSDNSDDSA